MSEKEKRKIEIWKMVISVIAAIIGAVGVTSIVASFVINKNQKNEQNNSQSFNPSINFYLPDGSKAEAKPDEIQEVLQIWYDKGFEDGEKSVQPTTETTTEQPPPPTKVVAYDKSGNVEFYAGTSGKYFTMSKKNYTSGYTVNFYSDGWLLYNLEGKYSNLKLDVGRVDGTGASDATLYVLLDGELAQSFSIGAKELAKTINIPLKNANQLELQMTGAGGSTYGLANTVFS